MRFQHILRIMVNQFLFCLSLHIGSPIRKCNNLIIVQTTSIAIARIEKKNQAKSHNNNNGGLFY